MMPIVVSWFVQQNSRPHTTGVMASWFETRGVAALLTMRDYQEAIPSPAPILRTRNTPSRTLILRRRNAPSRRMEATGGDNILPGGQITSIAV
jgi:hypothetical protein